MTQAQRDPGDNQIDFPGTPEQDEPRRDPGVEQVPEDEPEEDDVGVDPRPGRPRQRQGAGSGAALSPWPASGGRGRICPVR